MGFKDCKHEEELALLRLRVTELGTQVITDELTGLFNYRHLIQTLGLEIERVHRCGGEFSILIIDIDNFKRIDDIYGHEFGIQALTLQYEQHCVPVTVSTGAELSVLEIS